ncbi:MAG: transposase [Bacilli bacterium]
MIICTENDKNFNIYKDKVKKRKVVFTIKQIFEDHWNNFLLDNPNIKVRNVVYSNVNRMLKCKTTDLGFSLFVCEHCGKEKIVLHTCKSRMCSSCGNKYNKQRETSIFSKLIKCNHRHVVFTIPKELRIFFLKDRKRLNYLFKAASITVNCWIKNKYKKKDLIPAFVSILHTFGRSLVFNPHIHMILLDGGISNKYNEFVKINFFSYPSFRKRFMKVLLDMLEDDIGKNKFRKIKNQVYLSHKEGFYVFAPPSKFKRYTDLIKYVCRYVARPVMAESRILDYDGKFVTFWYQRHNDDLIIIEKVSVYEFIKRIIIHIPDYNYKQIRFYGAYHNSTIIKVNLNMYISKEKVKFKKYFNTWRFLLINSFKKDPLNCPNCNSIMLYYDSVFP